MVYFCWCPFVGIAAIGGQSGLEQGTFNNGHRTASWASIPPYTGANWKLVSVDFLRASFTAQVAYAQLGALMGVVLCSVAPAVRFGIAFRYFTVAADGTSHMEMWRVECEDERSCSVTAGSPFP
jgi:hypothetical protein